MFKTILKRVAILAAVLLMGQAAFAQAEKEQSMAGKKILVAYYSYSGNTQEVAEAIHEAVGGDLFEIKTLGFRGEALASIGAVSFVSLISKTKDSSTGGTIQISGGDMGVPTICGADNGTDITVQNLFYNVPARAKFLKKPKTEESEITDLVEKFILSNPTVSIKYIIDGKIRHISNGKGMMDAIYEVYGKNTLDNLLYFEQEYDDMRIYGFTSKPEFSKPNRTYQTIIINNRYIKNTTIQSAVTNAYGEVLMKKQFPFFVIYLDMDFSAVDVNVHPNKMEVRFENEGVRSWSI